MADVVSIEAASVWCREIPFVGPQEIEIVRALLNLVEIFFGAIFNPFFSPFFSFLFAI